MSVQAVAQTIQLILAPVVMVTACAVLLGGLLGHYSDVNSRLRALARERLDLLRASTPDALAAERLAEIDAQAPELLHRHRRMRDAVLTIYAAILVYLISMFLIAIAAALSSPYLATAVLALFLVGTGVLLLGVALTTLEVRQSHRAVSFELERVLSLSRGS